MEVNQPIHQVNQEVVAAVLLLLVQVFQDQMLEVDQVEQAQQHQFQEVQLLMQEVAVVGPHAVLILLVDQVELAVEELVELDLLMQIKQMELLTQVVVAAVLVEQYQEVQQELQAVAES